MFENIPHELKLYEQWILWKFEVSSKGKKVKIPYSAITGRRASVTESRDWSSFDEAYAMGCRGGFDGMGFVLTKNDPFVFIDLDDPKEDKEAIWHEQNCIANAFDSYAERSPSGKGLHIICKGSVPRARKTKIAEIYDCDRYMTMTGNVFKNAKINDCAALCNDLFLYLKGTEAEINEVIEGNAPPPCDDAEIVRRCESAANGQKFSELFAGNWQHIYASQSEADLALINIIAYYTQNGEQIKRIFLSSGMADREKAYRDSYFKFNLKMALDNAMPELDVDKLLETYRQTQVEKEPEQSPQIAELPCDSYSVPPGLMGAIATYIYNSAPRPVAEMALVGAIGLMAGIAGRAYNISRTGLNQYILLLAPTGTGKEGIAYGVNSLMNAISADLPMADGFIGPDKIGSEQALARHMSKGNNSFVSIIGEFGIQMAQMASTNAPPHLMGVKRSLLDLYNKSGHRQVARGSIYSDSEKNVGSCVSPAFSIIGESVPERFYSAIDESVVADGLLPRFTIMEYHGKRPPLREDFTKSEPSADLIIALRNLITNAKTLNTQNKVIEVSQDSESEIIFKQFDKFCDDQINATNADVTRQLWNRAHLKALKLAALIAVGNNIYMPQIDKHSARWAIDLVCRDVNNLLSKFKSGDVGNNNEEVTQLKTLCKFINDYISNPFADAAKYGATSRKMHDERVIPWAVIQKKLHKSAAFKNGRLSGTEALKRAVNTLCERGDITRVSPQDRMTRYETRQECYFVLNKKIGDAE